MTSIIALTRYMHLQVNICIHVQELKFIKTFAEYAIRLINYTSISKNTDVKEVPIENCILTHHVRYIKIPL